MQTDNGEEILDLVNENDEVIGRERRSVIYEEEKTNFRVVNIFVKNSIGQLWIPRRTARKKLFPNHLDLSAAGHVTSGETYIEAACKEVAEEANIDLYELGYKEVGYFTPRDGVSAFMKVYEVRYEQTPEYNLDDFSESYWLFPGELIQRIEEGYKAKSDLIKLVKMIYL